MIQKVLEPFLNWAVSKLTVLLVAWIKSEMKKSQIKSKNKAVTEKTLQANTKGERESAAENTINNAL